MWLKKEIRIGPVGQLCNLGESTAGKVRHWKISIDGTTQIGAGKNNYVNALHLMSTIVVDSSITLYQTEYDEKKHEIGVMQSMLHLPLCYETPSYARFRLPKLRV